MFKSRVGAVASWMQVLMITALLKQVGILNTYYSLFYHVINIFRQVMYQCVFFANFMIVYKTQS